MAKLPTTCDFCHRDAAILLTLESGAVICSRCRREESRDSANEARALEPTPERPTCATRADAERMATEQLGTALRAAERGQRELFGQTKGDR